MTIAESAILTAQHLAERERPAALNPDTRTEAVVRMLALRRLARIMAEAPRSEEPVH